VREYVTAEEARLRDESAALAGETRLETVAAQHGLREFLERLMSMAVPVPHSDSIGAPPGPLHRRPSSGAADSAGASGGGEGAGESGQDDDGLEGRIELHRRAILAHIADEFGCLEPVALEVEIEESRRGERSPTRIASHGHAVPILAERFLQRDSVCLFS